MQVDPIAFALLCGLCGGLGLFVGWLAGSADARARCAESHRVRSEAIRAVEAARAHMKGNDQRQVREDSQGLGEPGRLSPTSGVGIPQGGSDA